MKKTCIAIISKIKQLLKIIINYKGYRKQLLDDFRRKKLTKKYEDFNFCILEKPEDFVDKFNVILSSVEEKLIAVGKQEYIRKILAGEPDIEMAWFDFAVISLVLNQVENVLEIGTRMGESTIVLSRLFPKATVYTVDLPDDDPAHHRCIRIESNRLILEQNLSRKNITAIKCNSFFLPSLKYLPKQFELIYVDGDHSFPQVAGDIMFTYNRMRPGGFLFMHDYASPVVHPYEEDVCKTINWMSQYIKEEILLIPHFSKGIKSHRKMACLVKGKEE